MNVIKITLPQMSMRFCPMLCRSIPDQQIFTSYNDAASDMNITLLQCVTVLAEAWLLGATALGSSRGPWPHMSCAVLFVSKAK